MWNFINATHKYSNEQSILLQLVRIPTDWGTSLQSQSMYGFSFFFNNFMH